jgi:hypothetical protein
MQHQVGSKASHGGERSVAAARRSCRANYVLHRLAVGRSGHALADDRANDRPPPLCRLTATHDVGRRFGFRDVVARHRIAFAVQTSSRHIVTASPEAAAAAATAAAAAGRLPDAKDDRRSRRRNGVAAIAFGPHSDVRRTRARIKWIKANWIQHQYLDGEQNELATNDAVASFRTIHAGFGYAGSSSSSSSIFLLFSSSSSSSSTTCRYFYSPPSVCLSLDLLN